MRDYGKVHATFWTSPTTAKLSDDGKMLALYLLTCSHSTIAGVFRLPDGYIAEDLGWVPERVSKGFDELFRNGFANRCGTTKWVWIRRHFHWNRPENPNQRKAAAKIAQQIPSECVWRLDFIRECGPVLGLPPPSDPNPSGTVPKPFRNQEQEQKQEQDKSAEGKPFPTELKLVGQVEPEVPIRIPIVDGPDAPILQTEIDEWSLAFPAVDVLAELREMRVWASANRAKRKTAGGLHRFVVQWLQKAQNEGRKGASGVAAAAKAWAGAK